MCRWWGNELPWDGAYLFQGMSPLFNEGELAFRDIQTHLSLFYVLESILELSIVYSSHEFLVDGEMTRHFPLWGIQTRDNC